MEKIRKPLVVARRHSASSATASPIAPGRRRSKRLWALPPRRLEELRHSSAGRGPRDPVTDPQASGGDRAPWYVHERSAGRGADGVLIQEDNPGAAGPRWDLPAHRPLLVCPRPARTSAPCEPSSRPKQSCSARPITERAQAA